MAELIHRRVCEEGNGPVFTRVIFEMTREETTVTVTSRVYLIERVYQTQDWFILVPIQLIHMSSFSYEAEVDVVT